MQLNASERTFEDNRRKRPLDGGDDNPANKEPRTALSASCPWWNIPYDEQLSRKQAEIFKDCAHNMVSEIQRSYKGYPAEKCPSWLTDHSLDLVSRSSPATSRQHVSLEPIRPSPETTGYRNKCEFTFGKNADLVPSCGFRVSSYDEGVAIESPYDCLNVPRAMKQVVFLIEQFVREHASVLDVYDPITREGTEQNSGEL